MTPQDRKQLKDLRLADDVIARTEEVLRIWGEPSLFAKCAYCQKLCFHPDLPRRKHLRQKLPADLLHMRDMIGLRDNAGAVICWECDELQFQLD